MPSNPYGPHDIGPTLEAALRYAALGRRVMPLKPGEKVPALSHWPQRATTDPDTILRQFENAQFHAGGREPNVGIATGGQLGSQLVVLDIDFKHGANVPAWAEPTLTVVTPSVGFHFYYAVEEPIEVPSSTGRLARGLDVRAQGGQVVAPPSTVNGGTYEWLDESQAITTMPARFFIPADVSTSPAGWRTRFEYLDEVPVGQRNNYLTRLAGYLFATGEDMDGVASELILESDRLGFTPREGELASIVRSVARYHR